MGRSKKSPSPASNKKQDLPRKKATEAKASHKKKSETKPNLKGKKGKPEGSKKDSKNAPRYPPGEIWSKSKKKRMRQKLAGNAGVSADSGTNNGEMTNKRQRKEVAVTNDSGDGKGRVSTLQQSFMARLTGSRFRELNEDLYTSTSINAYEKFSSQPELYEQYHEGFRHQVEGWPINPVNVIVKWLASSYSGRENECVVADFGCGDAALAKKLLAVQQDGKCPFKVHSFDLVACCDLVTACDMSSVPLQNKSVDVAVFCLSLMGINLADFIREAHRVLKPNGVLKIAEVRSRFESKSDELEDFIDVLDKLGFTCARKDRSNKMFVMLELKLNGKRPDKNLEYAARPCIYKRR